METVIAIPAQCTDYKGCGEAWAAIKNNAVSAIRYTDRGQANRRGMMWKDHRNISLHELKATEPDAIFRGMCSCCEFIPASADGIYVLNSRFIDSSGFAFFVDFLRSFAFAAAGRTGCAHSAHLPPA